MHLIIYKWLTRQKCRQKRKQFRQKTLKWKEKLSMKAFSFIWICNRSCKCSFFFLISLLTYSHSLNDINSLHCFVGYLLYYLCIFSPQIALQLSQAYSQTNLLFEYIIFKNYSQRRVFHKVNLNNLQNVLTKKSNNRMSQGVHF